MKTFILSVCLLLASLTYAQNRIYSHTATAETFVGIYSYLDHPLLNGNANAKIIVTHKWTAEAGGSGVFNNNTVGLYYTGSRWALFNENLTPIVENSCYNIYINQDDEVITITSPSNQNNSFPIDHPEVNGNPNAYLAIQNYYNGVLNNKNYAFQYDNNTWYVSEETVSEFTRNAYFFLLINGVAVENARHLSTAANTTNNVTTIDHPLLNNNPEALLFISHINEIGGSEGVIPSPIGVYYNTTLNQWAIYREDADNIPVGSVFNLFIHDASMATDEMTASEFKIYPNPVKDVLNISNDKSIEKVEIFDLSGKKLIQNEMNSNKTEIDMSGLLSGIYIVKILSDGKTQTKKVIKK